MKGKLTNLLLKGKNLTKKQKLIAIVIAALVVILTAGAVIAGVYVNRGNQQDDGSVYVTFLNPDGSEIRTIEKQINDSLLEDEYPDPSEVKVSEGKKFKGWDVAFIDCLTEDVTITAIEGVVITPNTNQPLGELILEAEEAAYYNSEGEEVIVTASQAQAVKGVYFNSFPKPGHVTIDFKVVAEKDTTVKWAIKMGYRKGGTYNLADLFTFELKQAGASGFTKVKTEGKGENYAWDVIWADYVDVEVAEITLKKGENYISVIGIDQLYANVDYIKLVGDVDGLTVEKCDPIKRSSGATNTVSGLVVEAENTSYSTNTGDEVTISETEKGTVKSVYMKHPNKDNVQVTLEYKVISNGDKKVAYNIIMGHRKGGTHKLSDILKFEISYDGANYTEISTQSSLTNTHWNAEDGAGSKYGDMATAKIADVALKTGDNYFRVTGTTNLFANIDKFVYEGDTKGVSFKKPATYTITFQNPDGSVIKTLAKNENTTLSAKEYPKQQDVKVSQGLTFVGWSIDKIDKVTSNVTIKALEDHIMVMEAEKANFFSSTNEEVTVSRTQKETVQSVYMNKGQVYIEYTVISTKDTTLRLDITMGHRLGGTRTLKSMMKFEISHDGGSNYDEISTDGKLVNVHWDDLGCGAAKYGNMSTATIGKVSLKKGENIIRIKGNSALNANVDSLSFIGDVSCIKFQDASYTVTFLNPDGSVIKTITKNANAKITASSYPKASDVKVSEGMSFVGWDIPVIEKLTSDVTVKAVQKSRLLLEGEDAIITTSTGKEPVITAAQSSTSVFMKQDSSQAECIVTLEYAIHAEEATSVVMDITMGHRNGGENELEQLLDFEISRDGGFVYEKINTTAILKNTHWISSTANQLVKNGRIWQRYQLQN